jgi:multidrug efflux pump subunit AcrA (membrane-fusion protein)
MSSSLGNRRFLSIFAIVVVLAGAGGGWYYYNQYLPAQASPPAETIQTAQVRRGDLVITASGAGTLIPAAEVDLGFRTSGGVLVEMLVEVGDQVQAGGVLARVDDIDARKAVADAELQVAQAEATLAEKQDTTATEHAVALAEIQVAQAEASLASVQLKLDELLEWAPDENAVELAQVNLAAAQADYNKIAASAEYTDDQLTSARVNLEQATNQLEYAQAAYDTAWNPDRDWELNDSKHGPKLESERESTKRNLEKEQLDLEVAHAAYNLAVAGIDDTC